MDADSAGSLAAVAKTFPSFNQNEQATAAIFPLSGGAKTPKALFPLSDAETGAMAAAFLPWLFLLRIKRRLAQHRYRKRNYSAPSKRHFLQQIIAGIGFGQSRRGLFARRFRGAVAIFLAALFCVLPIHPTMTSQTVEVDESTRTVSVTFYEENLDANVQIPAIPINCRTKAC